MRKLYKPHDYQVDIMRHIIGTKRSGVWAGMGTGKTVSSLSAISGLQLSGDETKPFLCIAPLRVAKSTWPNEALKWDHLSGVQITQLCGPLDKDKSYGASERHHILFKELAAGNASGYTINYESVPWLIETLKETKKGWPFGMIIADELSKLKSYRTSQGGVRAKALSKVAHSMTERFVGLTGTPSPNGLQDLWGSTWFIDKGMRLGATFTAYKNRWFRSHPSGYGLQPVEWAEDEIHNLISDIYIAVDHKLNVDEPLTNIIAVDLPASARTTYRELEKLLFTEIGEHKIDVISGAAKAQKLLQVASGAVIHDTESRDWVEIHDVKMQALESVLSEANGMPVLVAYHYKSTMERLLKHFPQGRKFDTNPATERDWNAGLIPLMFIHPASGGHGSNLQDGGNIMVFIDHDWNLENYLQVIERIGPVRQKQAGHNRPVFLHYIVAKNTMDEVVLSRRKSKKTVQDSLLDAIKTRSIGRDYDYEL